MSGNTNFSVVQNAVLVGASNASAGLCVWNNGSGYVAATVANKGTGRATGIALTAASIQVPAFVLQTCGWLDAATSGLGAGAASWVRVNATTAALERCAPAGTDDVVGYCDAAGNVALIFGLFTAAIVNAAAGGAPTGTGIAHVVAGAFVSPATLVVDADINAAAAIAASKVVQATGTGIPHVVAGALAAASSLIVDADVSAAAAIAGTKVADTAAQAMGALNVDWSTGTVFTKTLGAGANALTFSGQASGKCISVRLTGAASTVTWPAVKWAGGVAPTQTASGTDVYTFVHDGTSIYGSVVPNMS